MKLMINGSEHELDVSPDTPCFGPFVTMRT